MTRPTIHRAAPPPVVAYEGPGPGKRVAALIKTAVGKAGSLHFGVAYVTRELTSLLQIRRARLRELTLVCDPWTGACDPEVLVQMHRGGAKVFARPSLHAKVYSGPGGVVVGSANLSKGALIRGTEEAVVLLTDGATKKAAVEWIKSLASKSTPLQRLRAAPAEWSFIVSAWRRRQRQPRAGRGRRPSLLEALRDPFAHDLTKVRIDLIDKDAPSIEAEAKAAAKRNRINRPPGWGYTYVDGPPTGDTVRAFVKKYEASVEGCAIFSLEVALDERQRRVTHFTAIRNDGGMLLGTAVNRNRIIWYYGPAPVPLNLRRDRKELLQLLNAALQHNLKLQERLYRRSWWSLKPKEIADILQTARRR